MKRQMKQDVEFYAILTIVISVISVALLAAIYKALAKIKNYQNIQTRLLVKIMEKEGEKIDVNKMYLEADKA